MTREEILKELGFKKKKCGLPNEFLYEKKYKTGLGIFELSVFFHWDIGKPISIFYKEYEFKEFEWSEKNIRKWDDYFTKMREL